MVTAHPDDVDFGAAGTVAAFTTAGVDVTYCIVTNGDAGGSDRTMSPADMAALRQGEQGAAAGSRGVRDVRFLGHPDGTAEPTLEPRRDISRVIRQVRPERLLSPSPERHPTSSSPAIPTTWRPERPRSTRSTPTPATPSHTPSCSMSSASSRGR